MRKVTAEMLVPVRRAIQEILPGLKEWGVAIRLHEALDTLVPGVRYETVARIRGVIADKLVATVAIGYSDLADRLRRVIFHLTDLQHDLDDYPPCSGCSAGCTCDD